MLIGTSPTTRYVRVYQDLHISPVADVINEFAVNHERRMHEHVNVEVLQLLDTTQDVRRLKRVKPYELV